MSDNDDIDLQPLLDAQQNQLGILMDVGASIDAKALGLFAAVTTILIFIAQSPLEAHWLGWASMLMLLFVSLGLTIAALYPRKYTPASADLSKHPEFYAMPKETLLLQLLADTQFGIERNEALNQRRWRYCVLAFLTAAAGTFLLFILLVVQ